MGRPPSLLGSIMASYVAASEQALRRCRAATWRALEEHSDKPEVVQVVAALGEKIQDAIDIHRKMDAVVTANFGATWNTDDWILTMLEEARQDVLARLAADED